MGRGQMEMQCQSSQVTVFIRRFFLKTQKTTEPEQVNATPNTKTLSETGKCNIKPEDIIPSRATGAMPSYAERKPKPQQAALSDCRRV